MPRGEGHSSNWGGARRGAGPKTQASAPKAAPMPASVPAQPRQASPQLSTEAMLATIHASIANKRNGARTPENNPFRLPFFPETAMPKEAGLRMAMDNVPELQWASTQWMTPGFSGWASEGLLFLGYPYLAELAQRPEYRIMSETIATEMTRKWIKFGGTGAKKKAKSKGASDEEAAGEQAVADDKNQKIKEFEDYLEHLKVRSCYADSILNDGLFGRSHLYHDFGTEGDELKTPIGGGRDDITRAKVQKGSLKRLQVVEPVWCYPTSYNATDPLAANWYNPDTWFVLGKQVHASRLLRFMSRPVPDMLKPAYAFGGLSLTQIAKPYVDIWLTTRESVGQLIHAFSVMVLSTNLATITQPGGADNLLMRLALFNAMRDNQGVFAVDETSEDFKNVSAPLSGLHELQAQSQEHMMSVARIPAVKFTGIEPTGMNASSEGTLRTFYDTMNAGQNHFVRPNLNVTVDIAQISLWGQRDHDLVYTFVPLWEMTEKEKGEKRKADAETDIIYVDGGVISPEEVRAKLVADPESSYQDIDPDDVPDLAAEEEEGLEPEGGRPDPKAEGEPDKSGGGANDAAVPFALDADWHEEEHPRAPDGKFGSGSGVHDLTDPSKVAFPLAKTKTADYAKSVIAQQIKSGIVPPVVEIPADKLRATQEDLNSPDMGPEDFAAKGNPFGNYDDLPVVMKGESGGFFFVADGHNRLSGRVRAGKPVRAYIFDEVDSPKDMRDRLVKEYPPTPPPAAAPAQPAAKRTAFGGLYKTGPSTEEAHVATVNHVLGRPANQGSSYRQMLAHLIKESSLHGTEAEIPKLKAKLGQAFANAAENAAKQAAAATGDQKTKLEAIADKAAKQARALGTETSAGSPPADPATAWASSGGASKELTAFRQASRDRLLEHGRKTNTEGLEGFDTKTGKPTTFNMVSRASERNVQFSPELMEALNNPDNKIELGHNHPSDTSLSSQDLDTQSLSPGMGRMYAYGARGSIYSVDSSQKGAGAALQAAIMGTHQDLVEQVVGGRLSNDGANRLHRHAAMIAMDKAGIVTNYQAVVAPDFQALIDQHKTLFAHLVDKAGTTLKRRSRS